jgi:hypothetical protein
LAHRGHPPTRQAQKPKSPKQDAQSRTRSTEAHCGRPPPDPRCPARRIESSGHGVKRARNLVPTAGRAAPWRCACRASQPPQHNSTPPHELHCVTPCVTTHVLRRSGPYTAWPQTPFCIAGRPPCVPPFCPTPHWPQPGHIPRTIKSAVGVCRLWTGCLPSLTS